MKSVDFDPGPGEDIHTVTGDNECIYLTKFTFDGDWLGVNVWGGNSVLDTGRGVGVDSSGSVYVTGRFSGTSDFDPGTGEDIHTSNGGGDIFLSKFNSTGAFQWAKTWGSSLDDPGSDYYYSEEGWDIAFDSENNAYVTGTFYMTVDFDPGPGEDWHISDKSPDVFLSKFNPSGEFQWARTWGGESDLTGYGVDTDPLDNVLVTGVWGDGAVDFDPGPGEDWHETNQDGLYVSKFNKSGDFIYATIWDELIYSLDIATDDSGDAYISGGFVSYGDGTDFDPGLGVDKHSSNGFHDSFIMKLPSGMRITRLI
jgi:hypothetical protein